MATTTRTLLEQNDTLQQRYHVLIEFAFKHLDFQIPELESVLDMHGISLGDDQDCRIHALPHQTLPTLFTRSGQRVNVHPIHQNNNNSTTKETGVTAQRPFLILSLPYPSPWVPRVDDSLASADHKQSIASIILERCALVRNVMELWGVSASLESCSQAVQEWIQTNVGKEIFPRVAKQSWKIGIHTLGSKYSLEEQAVMRGYFSNLGFQGPVVMKDPCSDLVLIREIELNDTGSARYPRLSHLGKLIPENDARPPLAWYFGRALCGNRHGKGRGQQQYSLKKRKYLGPTSMDSELSFIMTNLGQCRKGSVAFDPFVGTGSILLSCALRGAFCIGTDIDFRVLQGLNKTENVFSNFRQYSLPRPELIRSDNSIYHRHYRNTEALYNVIICDPPYGIRAGARKSGTRKEQAKPVADEHRYDHIAQTKPYKVSDVMVDLLDVAAKTLKMSGRLVYVIPSYKDFDQDSDLPQHECLTLIHVCYQPLTLELGRRTVAMEKVVEYDMAKRESYLKNVWKNGPESAEKCADIREKILENARQKPGYEAKLAHRKQKRKENKEAKRAAKRAAAEMSGNSPK